MKPTLSQIFSVDISGKKKEIEEIIFNPFVQNVLPDPFLQKEDKSSMDCYTLKKRYTNPFSDNSIDLYFHHDSFENFFKFNVENKNSLNSKDIPLFDITNLNKFVGEEVEEEYNNNFFEDTTIADYLSPVQVGYWLSFFFNSEIQFIEDVDFIINDYYHPLLVNSRKNKDPLMKKEHIDQIFTSIQTILEIHQDFLEQLEIITEGKKIEKSMLFQIFFIFTNCILSRSKIYEEWTVLYCRDIRYLIDIYERHSNFSKYQESRCKDKTKDYKLSHFAPKIISHISHYPLIFESLFLFFQKEELSQTIQSCRNLSDNLNRIQQNFENNSSSPEKIEKDSLSKKIVQTLSKRTRKNSAPSYLKFDQN